MSDYVLTEPEESVLKKGLNFVVTTSVFNLDVVYAAESLMSKLPQDMITVGKVKTLNSQHNKVGIQGFKIFEAQ
jgi:hypothetical protein